MGGLPDQTIEEMRDEMRFIASLAILVKPVFLSPVPFTKLFSRYARQFPRLETDPLFHNDTFFISRLPGWSAAAVEEIKAEAREMNTLLLRQDP
jgi:hypothetical protein